MIKKYLNQYKFNNKKIFILGGLGLIGRSVLNTLLSTNGKIFILDIKKISLKMQKDFKKKSKSVSFIHFDCSNMNNLDRNLDKIFSNYGCPDVFINCSYPATDDWAKSNFSNNKLSLMRKNIDSHLNSYSWISFRVCEQMKKKNIKGSIILLSSIYGFLGQNVEIYKKTSLRENMNYSIIKGGIINLCRQLAAYYGKFNIRINTVSPGGILGGSKGLKKKQDKNFIKNYSKQSPLKRLGKPEEVASAILFLASDASSYVTGSNLVVDGGWSAI